MLFVSFRYLYEFMAEDRAQGQTFVADLDQTVLSVLNQHCRRAGGLVTARFALEQRGLFEHRLIVARQHKRERREVVAGCELLAQLGDFRPGQLVATLVEFMAGVALEPAPVDGVARDQSVQLLPQILVLHRLLRRRFSSRALSNL